MLKRVLALVIGTCFILFSVPAQAAYEKETIKIGLYYASTAKASVGFKITGNISVGYEYENAFYPILEQEASEVTVSKGDGIYLKVGGNFENAAQALNYGRDVLKLNGTQNIIGYIDEQYALLMGPYQTADEAGQAQVTVSNNSGQACAVFQTGGDSVLSSLGNSYRVLFRHAAYHFAFKPAAGDGYTEVGGKKYAGIMLFNRVSGSDMTVINLLPTEEYLYSVVGSEMPSSWHIEALKVQAVASRTYVASYGTQFAKYGFNLAGSTVSQAYDGLAKKTASTIEAVNSTAGEVVLYEGKPISALFGSMSGGRTADSRSAWGSTTYIPYLRSVDDSYEKTEEIGGVWQVEMTPGQIKEKLAAKGIDIGEITDVAVLERGQGDERVTKLQFIGTAGEKTITYESTRTYLGLKSQYYYVSRSAPGAVSVAAQSAYGVSDVSLAGASVLSAGGISTAGANVWVQSAAGIAAVSIPGSGNFIFSGRGYGHGVGMSQHGAHAMADLGFGYRDILLHYYPDTQIGK